MNGRELFDHVSRPRMVGSLPVPSVQEIAAKQLQDVPHRYIRLEEDRPSANFISTPNHTQIPVIDMKKLLSGDSDEMGELHIACQDWGFFQLINHGVPCSLMDKIKTSTRQFFDLPLEEKRRYGPEPGDLEGYGQAFVVSEEQKLDWGDMMYPLVKPTPTRNMRLWPKVAVNLLSAMAQNLGLQPHYFIEMFGDAVQAMRFNYYPPCPQPELVLGLSPHSDGGGITILLQDEVVEGLNIKKNDSWIPVKPLPNALVVNIGDSLEIMSNGRYKSIEHRAITNKDKERISIVTVYSVGYDVQMVPSPHLVDEAQPCLYKMMSFGDYMYHFTSNKLQGKRTLDMVKLNPPHQN
eukprot:Gb_05888 [translate_table: standard]